MAEARKTQNKRALGSRKEELAMGYLRRNGARILAHGFRLRQGEIDIIAEKDHTVCFIEVKYRKNAAAGAPEEAVDFRKQRRICKCADYFLLTHPTFRNYQMRFDVIGILGEELRYTENAFPYCGDGF